MLLGDNEYLGRTGILLFLFAHCTVFYATLKTKDDYICFYE